VNCTNAFIRQRLTATGAVLEGREAFFCWGDRLACQADVVADFFYFGAPFFAEGHPWFFIEVTAKVESD
jgi:hypothetical protein